MKIIRIFFVLLILNIILVHNSVSQIIKEGDFYTQRENRVINISDEKDLILRISNGDINIITGNVNTVEVNIVKRIKLDNEKEASEALNAFISRYETNGNKIEILSKHKFGFYYLDFYSDFTITIPEEFNLTLSTKSGNIEIDKLSGNVSIDCEIGNVKLKDIFGDVHISLFEGDIDLGNIGNDLFIKTGGGKIKAGDTGGFVWIESAGGPVELGNIKGKADITTMAGDITIKSCGESVKANSAGGSILLGTVTGPVDLETGAGNIEVASAEKLELANSEGGNIKLFNVDGFADVNTRGGNVFAEIISDDLDRSNSINLKSGSGDVTAYISNRLKASLSLAARKGKSPIDGNEIHSDYPITYSKDDRGNQIGTGTLNGGGTQIYIESYDGNITIKEMK